MPCDIGKRYDRVAAEYKGHPYLNQLNQTEIQIRAGPLATSFANTAKHGDQAKVRKPTTNVHSRCSSGLEPEIHPEVNNYIQSRY
jgi:hypothetical protein